MAVAQGYTLYAVQTAAGIIDQIESAEFAPGVGEVLVSADGTVDDEFAAVMSARPVLSFTTTAIDKALDIAGISGYKVAAASDFFFQKLEQQGVRTAGATHLKISTSLGFLLPRTLQGSQDGPATISYDLICLSSSGSADAVVFTDSQSLTGMPKTDELYTIGECKLNNAVVNSVQSIAVDFGIGEITLAGDGHHYPTFASIISRRMTIGITAHDIPKLAGTPPSFGTVGVAIGSSTLVGFQAITQGATPSGTDKTFTVNEGRITAQRAGGGNDAPVTADYTITPTYDGSNAVVVISA